MNLFYVHFVDSQKQRAVFTCRTGKNRTAKLCRTKARGSSLGFLTKFHFAKFHETGYEMTVVFRENEGRVSRVSQFRKTAEITKETGFAKHKNRENKENLK
jgi:hypothetical protein